MEQNTQREKLIDLIVNAKKACPETEGFTEFLADFLIGYGVIVPDNTYNFSRLRDLVQADRDGRCVISPKEGVLNKGDRVWYVDIKSRVLESGTVFIVEYKDGKLDSFSVNFDSGDFDEFLGIAWGDCIFGSKKSAEEALEGENP